MQARAAWRWARNFYPRPPRGGRRIVQPFRSKPFGFLSTPSARRATTYRKEQPSALTISIHALREEGDRLDTISNISRTHFYPRPPRGGRRTCGRHGQSLRHFYPRPPRGGRPCVRLIRRRAKIFLSTPSARRATPDDLKPIHKLSNFYPRPPRGGRPVQARAAWRWARNFYPRPPRGGRRIVQPFRSKPFGFLSTPSARRATTYRKEQPSALTISIHALREEGDRLDTISNISRTHFYPRPPRGGRPTSMLFAAAFFLFLSTPSARRATVGGAGRKPSKDISIHALREEGDLIAPGVVSPGVLFLSTPSARRATLQTAAGRQVNAISIHALREEGDFWPIRRFQNLRYFYPRPPRGGRRASAVACALGPADFYPRPPRGGRPLPFR